jgi:hypothetical protein
VTSRKVNLSWGNISEGCCEATWLQQRGFSQDMRDFRCKCIERAQETGPGPMGAGCNPVARDSVTLHRGAGNLDRGQSMDAQPARGF